MQNKAFETKNFVITNMGEYIDNDTNYTTQEYLIHVRNINCLDLKYVFDDKGLAMVSAENQNNKFPETKELTDFTYKINELIENDVVEIIEFMEKFL